MPGRSYLASFGGAGGGCYRYGFNGKENDNEVKGQGNQQDYGMRIYDPRICRFLTTDPLSISYPSISPYPYAMNRPLDGIDLDGLEWIHYNIKYTLNANGERVILEKSIAKDYRKLPESELNAIHKTNSFFKKYSQGFGSEGQGVKYTYQEFDANGKFVSRKDEMEIVSSIKRHGFYAGTGCITKNGELITPGKYGNYDFGMMPIDMADAISKLHDRLQNIPNHKGFEHEDYLNSDIIFLHMMVKFRDLYQENPEYIDPFTGRKVSDDQKKFVDNAIILFQMFVMVKEKKLKENLKKGKITQAQFEEKTKLLRNSGVASSLPLPNPTDKVNKGSN